MSDEQKPQPAPKKDGVEVYSLLDQYLKDTTGEHNTYLRKKLRERYDFGKKKYQQPLMTSDGRDGPKDLEEECLDSIYYLVKCLHNGDKIDNAKMMLKTINDILYNVGEIEDEPKEEENNDDEDEKLNIGTSPCTIL